MDRFTEESPLTYAEHNDNNKPFFTEGQPCESCGRPCEDRITAYWAPELQVGACCMAHSDEVCADFLCLVETCRTVAEVSCLWSEHMASCDACLAIDLRTGVRLDRKPAVRVARKAA